MKVLFTTMLLTLILTFAGSCTREELPEREVLLTKNVHGRYGPHGCIQYCGTSVCRFGVRCAPNHAGGCKRETSCFWLSDIWIGTLSASDPQGLPAKWDSYPFWTNEKAQKTLWLMDSSLFEHPDSVIH